MGVVKKNKVITLGTYPEDMDRDQKTEIVKVYAMIVCCTDHALSPGEDISFRPNTKGNVVHRTKPNEKRHGIVDPFLVKRVFPNQLFNMLVDPEWVREENHSFELDYRIDPPMPAKPEKKKNQIILNAGLTRPAFEEKQAPCPQHDSEEDGIDDDL
jgi:hypothetical protein